MLVRGLRSISGSMPLDDDAMFQRRRGYLSLAAGFIGHGTEGGEGLLVTLVMYPVWCCRLAVRGERFMSSHRQALKESGDIVSRRERLL